MVKIDDVFAADKARIDAEMSGAKERVWEAVSLYARVDSVRRSGSSVRHRFWRSYVNIPVPVFALTAAAAGIIAVFALTVLVRQANLDTRNQELMAVGAVEAEPPWNMDRVPASGEMEMTRPQMFPVASMNDVLRYLDAENGNRYAVIKLPDKNFKQVGEPVIVKLKK
jgi:hypothetical protein